MTSVGWSSRAKQDLISDRSQVRASTNLLGDLRISFVSVLRIWRFFLPLAGAPSPHFFCLFHLFHDLNIGRYTLHHDFELEEISRNDKCIHLTITSRYVFSLLVLCSSRSMHDVFLFVEHAERFTFSFFFFCFLSYVHRIVRSLSRCC